MRSSRLPVVIGCLTVVIIVACGPAKSGGSDTANSALKTAAAPVTFTKAQFGAIRWVEGRWRGLDVKGKPFFEAYRMIDDSTMHEGTFSDSTFKTQTDSAIIGWRNGLVVDRGNGKPWNATHLDSAQVGFALVGGKGQRFAWFRHSPDEWEAQIFTPDVIGHEVKVVYRMQRVR
jgi:hypothetical protein